MMQVEQDNAVNTVEEFIRITTLLTTETDLNQLLEGIVSAARKITRADAGMVYLLDKTKRYLYVDVLQSESLGKYQYDFPRVELYKNNDRNMKNVVSLTAFTGQMRHFEDAYQHIGYDFSDFLSHDKAVNYRTQSITAVALRSHENITLGILVLINFQDPETEKIIKMLPELVGVVKAFAAQAAVAINNVQLIKNNRHLIDVLNNSNKKLEEENQVLRQTIQGKYDFSKIIGDSPAMQQVFALMEKIIDSDATVLIRGDTGTGKELIAHALHYNSRRRKKPFVIQNCAALPDNLLESELFGYKKGAFSGAITDKKGLIEIADGGTLFLDEIGDMPIGLQAKLLRVLQDKVVRPLGCVEGQGKKINVRILAATHCDLKQKIEAKEFREDLYYRLCVFPIDLPPVAQRKEDIPKLLQHFLEQFSGQYTKPIEGFSPSAMDKLIKYPYPGNIRDMKNILERAVLMCEADGYILEEHLSEEVLYNRAILPPESIYDRLNDMGSLKDMMANYEAQLIKEKLVECEWNQTKAAAELNIARRTIIEKISRYEIEEEQNPARLN